MDRDQPQGSSQANTSAANPQIQQQQQQVMSAESSTHGPPPAPPKTEADRVRSMSYQPAGGEREEGAYSVRGSERGDQTYGRGGIPSPAQARSREGRGEGLGPPNRRRASGLDWIIPAVDGGEKAYQVSTFAESRIHFLTFSRLKAQAKNSRRAFRPNASACEAREGQI